MMHVKGCDTFALAKCVIKRREQSQVKELVACDGSRSMLWCRSSSTVSAVVQVLMLEALADFFIASQ